MCAVALGVAACSSSSGSSGTGAGGSSGAGGSGAGGTAATGGSSGSAGSGGNPGSGGASGNAGAGGSAGSGNVPAACASGGAYLWNHLETCGWPGPNNTGYEVSQCAGGVLKPSTLPKDSKGIVHVTQNNTVISCQIINGCVEVQATGVVIKNNLIHACNGFNIRSGANGTGAVVIDDGASATVDHNELDGQKQVHACVWHQGVSMTATANNCHDVDDGMFGWADTGFSQTTGDHFTITGNYFHDFTTKTSNGHIDGYQTEGAANGVIRHNTYLMTSDANNSTDSAVAIWDSLKDSHDITVEDNLIAGGGFSIYAEDYSPSETSPSGGNSVTKIYFNNNSFSTHLFGCVGYYGVWYPRGSPTDQWNRSGNVVLETGENLDNTNPHVNGTLCH